MWGWGKLHRTTTMLRVGGTTVNIYSDMKMVEVLYKLRESHCDGREESEVEEERKLRHWIKKEEWEWQKRNREEEEEEEVKRSIGQGKQKTCLRKVNVRSCCWGKKRNSSILSQTDTRLYWQTYRWNLRWQRSRYTDKQKDCRTDSEEQCPHQSG